MQFYKKRSESYGKYMNFEWLEKNCFSFLWPVKQAEISADKYESIKFCAARNARAQN